MRPAAELHCSTQTQQPPQPADLTLPITCRLRVETQADLQRAVLQSTTASIAVPELELALSTGSGGGLATTVGDLIGSVSSGG